jgi:dihydrofolate reductase
VLGAQFLAYVWINRRDGLRYGEWLHLLILLGRATMELYGKWTHQLYKRINVVIQTTI